jgi:hypothetical protein
MMDSVGQSLYVVEIVLMCVLAMRPLCSGVLVILCRWQIVSRAAWDLREGRP